MNDRSRWDARWGSVGSAPIKAPSAFLHHHIDRLPRGIALDLASGDGRNSLELARHGFSVEAVDISFAGLARARAAARADALPVRLIQADLHQWTLQQDRYDVVVNIRYLHRELWPAIKSALRDDGVLVFETFLRDQMQIGHPRNPDFLLERGELAAAFADFELLVYEEGRFEADGDPAFLARMLARRPAGWNAD